MRLPCENLHCDHGLALLLRANYHVPGLEVVHFSIPLLVHFCIPRDSTLTRFTPLMTPTPIQGKRPIPVESALSASGRRADSCPAAPPPPRQTLQSPAPIGLPGRRIQLRRPLPRPPQRCLHLRGPALARKTIARCHLRRLVQRDPQSTALSAVPPNPEPSRNCHHEEMEGTRLMASSSPM